MTGAVLNNSKNDGQVLLSSGEGGPKRRMRVARPTIRRFLQNRGAGYPHPALRATLSQRKRARAIMRILLLSIFIALGVSPIQAQSLQPAGWDSQIKLRDAIDINPDPHIVEINIEAKVARVELEPGREVEAWTYNGGIPGPLIRLH